MIEAELIIFDVDDTLCLTEEACFNFENSIVTSMGLPPMPREAHQQNWGKLLEEAISERVPGIDVKEFSRRVEKTINQLAKEGRIDKVDEKNLKVLDELIQRGKKLAILTSRTKKELGVLMEPSHPIAQKMTAFYHKENTEFTKPDPRVFEKILKDFNTTPSKAVYIGDTLSDAICSLGASLNFIAVLENGLRTEVEFKTLGVKYIAPKFEDILRIVA